MLLEFPGSEGSGMNTLYIVALVAGALVVSLVAARLVLDKIAPPET